ncbi:MAG: ABC transporter permease [Lachnospiraceae bacterium]|nr:ABC transporter permease [Lachnospiraceae bacterium]
MFLHAFKYRLKALLHQKDEIFWNLLFPLILGTCFYAAFSNITKSAETFETIPVAVVLEDSAKETYFVEMMDGLSESSGDEVPFFATTYTDLAQGEELLATEKVDGLIVLNGGIPSLTITENGITQTMIKAVLDKYIQTNAVVNSMIPNHLDKLEAVMVAVTTEATYIRTLPLTHGNTDPVMDYFFALIAMSCLMATTVGQYVAMHIKADLSPIGLRKVISPANRISMILGDMSGSFTLSAVGNAMLIIYLKYILKLEFGAGFLPIFLVSLIGSLMSICIGMMVGFLPKLGEGAKLGINISFTLFSSFLSGLMASGIKQTIERTCPIINRINPASLISDALYALNIYDTYEKYTRCLIIMLAMSLIFVFVSLMITRRETYDSI